MKLLIKIVLALFALYAFIHLAPNPKPDRARTAEAMIPLPEKPLGRFETETAARQCGAILGRVVRCHLPRDDRSRLITYCVDGLADADGLVNTPHNAPLYEAFLDGTSDGERNIHGWTCGQVQKTLRSPLLPSRSTF